MLSEREVRGLGLTASEGLAPPPGRFLMALLEFTKTVPEYTFPKYPKSVRYKAITRHADENFTVPPLDIATVQINGLSGENKNLFERHKKSTNPKKHLSGLPVTVTVTMVQAWRGEVCRL